MIDLIDCISFADCVRLCMSNALPSLDCPQVACMCLRLTAKWMDD